jgi:hypothetical protein
MTLIPETGSPRTADFSELATVEESILTLSGLRVVLTHRGSRQTLEIDDAQCGLIGVISDSHLDPAVVRGGWRGVRDGQPWALVVGRSVPGEDVSVDFSLHHRRLLGLGRRSSRPTTVKSMRLGEFWIAEAAIEATHAVVAIPGLTAETFELEPVAG